MIFSGERNGISHIEMIRNGTKTQTRRMSNIYEIGKSYAVQPGRGKKAVHDIRIRIINKWPEGYAPREKNEWPSYPISTGDAEMEGGYTPREYEELFERMYPGWLAGPLRWAYEFEVVKKA